MVSDEPALRAPRLLLVYADTGAGHRASAKAVAEDLRERFAAEVHLVDPSDAPWYRPLRRTIRMYNPIVRVVPSLWGAIYHLTNSRIGSAVSRRVVTRTYRRPLARVIAQVQPDAVISFHPLLSWPMKLAARGLPAAVVVTDLGAIHRSWVGEGFDLVAAPSEAAAFRMRSLGVGNAVIRVTGLPVRQQFLSGAKGELERSRLRMEHGMGDRFTVLLSGGGAGFGALYDQAQALLERLDDVVVVVVCGHNERLRRKAEQLRERWGSRVVVHGFVDDMAAWVRAADVVAAKAGPGTIAEALTCGRPVVITGAIPGQERANIQEVLDLGAGMLATDEDALVGAVRSLRDEPAAIGRLRDAASIAKVADTSSMIAHGMMGIATGAVPVVADRAKGQARRTGYLQRRAVGAAAAAFVTLMGLTAGADKATAMGLFVPDAPRGSSVAYTAVRVDAEGLSDPRLLEILQTGGSTVVLDHATVAAEPVAVQDLLASGADIANGGQGGRSQRWMDWRRAEADVRLPPDLVGTAAQRNARVRLFVPGRHVNGFDLIYSRAHHQGIMEPKVVTPHDPVQCPAKRPMLIDLRHVPAPEAIAYLDAISEACQAAGLHEEPLGSLFGRSHQARA